MRFDCADFEWDESNELKLWQRHRVTTEESEEVFLNPNVVLYGKKVPTRPGQVEGRYYSFGRTDAGRLLFQVFLFRERTATTARIRVISSRNMTDSESRWFRKRQGD